MRPLLVGESNPAGGNPDWALYPYPPGCAGDRMRSILGLTHWRYLHLFDRTNLSPEPWDLTAARASARSILRGPHSHLVLLGRRVAWAFYLDLPSFTMVDYWSQPHQRRWHIYLLPHPSGRCLTWNDPASAPRARHLLWDLLYSGDRGRRL